LKTLVNEVSLSPWTNLVERMLRFVDVLRQTGFLTAEQALDLFGSILIQIGRHLSAYDLITFHHRGANYPDAFLLDALLKSYLRLSRVESGLSETPVVARSPDRAILWRRGLRQGWLLRRFYEGHPVPDWPTSPGENNRVLPTTHPRVPEEQILQPALRKRR